MAALSGILSPVTVYEMNDDLVSFIAGESQASRTERVTLSKQVEVLTKGSETCKRFAKVRLGSQLGRALLEDSSVPVGDSATIGVNPAPVDNSATTEDELIEPDNERRPTTASWEWFMNGKKKKGRRAETPVSPEADAPEVGYYVDTPVEPEEEVLYSD